MLAPRGLTLPLIRSKRLPPQHRSISPASLRRQGSTSGSWPPASRRGPLPSQGRGEGELGRGGRGAGTWRVGSGNVKARRLMLIRRSASSCLLRSALHRLILFSQHRSISPASLRRQGSTSGSSPPALRCGPLPSQGRGVWGAGARGWGAGCEDGEQGTGMTSRGTGDGKKGRRKGGEMVESRYDHLAVTARPRHETGADLGFGLNRTVSDPQVQ